MQEVTLAAVKSRRTVATDVRGRMSPKASVSARKVFLSSPFQEPLGLRWAVRSALYDRLRSDGWAPWLFEVEGEGLKRRHGLSDLQAILHGIVHSDVVVVFFKTRAGSYLDREAFVATVFEVLHARRLQKATRLYVVGRSYKPTLDGILATLASPFLLPDEARLIENEQQLVDVVATDLSMDVSLSSSSACQPESPGIEAATELDRFWLEGKITALDRAARLSHWAAAREADDVPCLMALRMGDLEKHLYAELLAKCSGPWSNQARYADAVRAAGLSARYFMELGDWRGMFAQIQALSSFLRMKGDRRAERVNAFGLRAARRTFPELLPAFEDARASIHRSAGRWQAAKQQLKRFVRATEGGSAYALSKYASVLAASSRRADIDSAARITYEQALPIARATGANLSYTLKEAASLALLQGERREAETFATEAERLCSVEGSLHTLESVRRVQSVLRLTAPPSPAVF